MATLILIGQDTIWGIGDDRASVIAEAQRNGMTFDDDEWERLMEDGRTGDLRNEDTFQIVECSEALARLVESHGGQVSFRLVDVDGPAVTVDEYAAAEDAPVYTLHFLDRDAEGSEHNGGEPMGVDSIDEAVRECVERGSRGEVFEGDRKVATMDADGSYGWL